jgi:hypothetical protein
MVDTSKKGQDGYNYFRLSVFVAFLQILCIDWKMEISAIVIIIIISSVCIKTFQEEDFGDFVF